MLNLSEDALKSLEGELLKGIRYRTGKNFKDKDKRVLTIPVDSSTTLGLLQAVLEGAAGSEHDFFVSISSEKQSLVVEIPSLVLQLQSSIGGRISFSYTCTSDPD